MDQLKDLDFDDQLLNSSDQEFEVPVKRHFRAGLKSIEAMHQNRKEDRLSSKKALRELDDVRGAPGTVYHRHLWMNRLENYAKSTNIVFDPIRGPTADILIRFVDTIVNHIEVRLEDKAAPNFQYVRGAINKLESALTFKYPEFKLSSHDCARVDAIFAKLANQKKLFRGRWRERQWLGANVLEKMSRSWLRLGLDAGCNSWDVHLQKLLSVVMLSAVGCRAGELALSEHYTEEYMRWKHVTLKLGKEGNTLDDVEASILLCFEKNKKLEIGDDRSVPLKALRYPSMNFICPIKLLLIQALRSGNVGPCLDDVLLQTSRRFDRTIQWNFPDRPVFPAMKKPAYTFLDWDRAASTHQLRNTTIQIAAAAGVLTKVTSHDWRRGYARDIANTKRSSKLGVADNEVAKSLGHSLKSMHTGVTDGYIGDIEVETYTGRAEELFESRKQPAIGEPYRKVPVTSQEVDDYCRQNNIDPRSKTGRSKAAYHLRAKHKSEWIDEHKNATTVSVSTLSKTQERRTLSNEIWPKKYKSTRSIRTQSPLAEISTQATEGRPNATSQMLPTSEESPTVDILSSIDPRLLPEGQDTAEIDARDYQRFESLLIGDAPEPTEQETEEALDLMVENMELSQETGDVLTIETHKFIDFFCKINIVRNSALIAGARLAAKIPEKVSTGNTRDYPTLYLFECSLCRSYKCTSQETLNIHELTCKPREEKPKLFKCPREGCGQAFESDKGLQNHIAHYHDWRARMCSTLGCSDKVFQNMRQWQHHLNSKHNPLETPTRCTVPDCKSSVVWETYYNYAEHLKKVHKLVTAPSRKPYLGDYERALHWPVGQCPIGGTQKCGTAFKQRRHMMQHLTAKEHEFSNEEAEKIADQVESQVYVLVNAESGAHGENDGDEDLEESKDQEEGNNIDVKGMAV